MILNWDSLTGGTDGISGIPNYAIGDWRLDSPGRFLRRCRDRRRSRCFWVCRRLARSPFGRALRAMRENEDAAEAVGKNILYMKVTVFAFSAGLAAVAGALFARYFTYVGAQSFTIDETIYILAMVILGGTGQSLGLRAGRGDPGGAAGAAEVRRRCRSTSPTSCASSLYGLVWCLILRFRPEGLLPEPRGARAMFVPVDAERRQASTRSNSCRREQAAAAKWCWRGPRPAARRSAASPPSLISPSSSGAAGSPA